LRLKALTSRFDRFGYARMNHLRGGSYRRRSSLPPKYSFTETAILAVFLCLRHVMQNLDQSPIWSTWPERLPAHPLCADAFVDGVRRLPRGTALAYRHVEFNTAGCIGWLNFDVDRRDSFECWDRAHLPAPNAYVQNPSNGHGHLLYAIATPVGLTGFSRERPIALAADVQRGMTRRLKADVAYANRIAKNPSSKRWRTGWFSNSPYELSFLLDALDRHDVRPALHPSVTHGISRNVDVFNSLRQFAYANVRAAKKTSDQAAWIARLVQEASVANQQFAVPLSLSELRQIAKSVGKWTWRHFDDAKFSKLQATRRAVGVAKRRNEMRSKIDALLGVLS